jgi:hypothetical protein
LEDIGEDEDNIKMELRDRVLEVVDWTPWHCIGTNGGNEPSSSRRGGKFPD